MPGRMRPVLIAAPPRSGTSMLAALLGLHGVWIGRTGVSKHPEVNSPVPAENLDVKRVMKEHARAIGYRNWRTPLPDLPADALPRLRDEVLACVPADVDHWLVKTSWTLTFHRAWHAAFPEATWLLPERPLEDVVASMHRHPAMHRNHPDRQMRRFAKALQGRQRAVMVMTDNYLFVDMDLLVDNVNYAHHVLDFAGVEPDEEKIAGFVDRKRWHGSAG